MHILFLTIVLFVLFYSSHGKFENAEPRFYTDYVMVHLHTELADKLSQSVFKYQKEEKISF